MKKYKLKLDYTADELKELKELGKYYSNPMTAVYRVARVIACNDPFRNLWKKYKILDIYKEFDFMADISNVVMGTAIFPEDKYVVHDKVTNRYICFDKLKGSLYWSQLRIPEAKTKEEWLKINPAYEPMLEKVED